jgi:hypothetical protein
MSPYPSRLELVVLGSDPDAAREVAAASGGIAYLANEATHERAPFQSIVRAVVSDPDQLAPAADIAMHLVFSRQIKSHDVTWAAGEMTPGVVGAFGLKGREGKSHQQTDDHWHHTHAPLALTHHAAMWDYVQLSVVRTLSGPELDGIALCLFPTLEDHNERFFNDEESEKIINADVASFADLRKSPRPAILSELLPG